ncbi:hypothetical protein [Gorillibacterium sp. CAU 1737]|uniref:hypothetical protein n=1 Tax=Gorillibacterium sp. CAU 1737 TaxID=3140362 RepID=UPI0032602C67
MAYIGIDRGIIDHWIYKDAEYFKVWFEMLCRARYSQEPKTDKLGDELFTINYGEFIFGRISWSDRLGISEQRLRTLMKLLVKEDMISLVFKFRRFSIYKITNYEKFNQQNNQQETLIQQDFFDGANQQINRDSTSSQPAANQQPTTKEPSKPLKPRSNKDKTYTPEFLKFWEAYPKRVDQPAAFNNFKKALKKVSAEILIGCAMNYASYCIANQTEHQYIKLPNNFLRDEYYKQYETPVLVHDTSQKNGTPRQYKGSKPSRKPLETIKSPAQPGMVSEEKFAELLAWANELDEGERA